MERSRVIGCLLGVSLLLWTQVHALAATTAADVVFANTPAQMLDLANQALASGQLSAQDRARILVRRGLAREMLGQRDLAVQDFSEAISSRTLLGQEQSAALYDRGVTFDELQRPNEAIDDYTAALRLEPKLAAALNNRANALRGLGRLAEARRDYETSIAAGNPNPEYPDYGMGQIAEALGQPTAAREYYRAALLANPQFTPARERLAALGGAPVTVMSEPPVVLKDPARQPAPVSTKPALPAAEHPNPELKPAVVDAESLGGRSVQLGAWRTEAEATGAWNEDKKSAGDVLGALNPVILPVDLPGQGRYFRLRIGQLDRVSAPRLCASLKAKGVACILVPG